MSGTGGSLDPAGPAAGEIARVWWVLLGLGLTVFIAVAAFMVVGLLRARSSNSPSEKESFFPNRWIVAGGVVMPGLVLGVVFGVSLSSMSVLDTEVPADAVVVEVTGNQWWWEVSYEGHEFSTANEMHIPVDRPVLVRLASNDVIHSYWVPRLGGKIDALPDYPNSLIIEADEPGEYEGNCAEFCGLQHANMGILVVAKTEAEYEEWLESQESKAMVPTSGEAAEGAEIFLASRCVECHTIRGTPADGEAGPDLTHIASRARLGADALPNTAENLRRWVADPQEVKVGVNMPDVPLTEEEIDAITAFLETLR